MALVDSTTAAGGYGGRWLGQDGANTRRNGFPQPQKPVGVPSDGLQLVGIYHNDHLYSVVKVQKLYKITRRYATALFPIKSIPYSGT